MSLALSHLNGWAVLAAYIPYFVLGPLWFLLLFGQAYQSALGRGADAPPTKAPIFIVGPALCTLAITIATAILMQWLNIDSAGATLVFALLIGLGFLVANTVNIAINPNIPRPLFYSLITGSYHLVSIIAACFILYALH